ncbi:MAG: glycine--tRNA ligase subunit alpha [Elusimicrobiales bacterium]|nr:glycine--tRNA ligase subunit alpha [Elusimicrobiales bacterium]
MDFQDIILKLNQYWAKQGCAVLPPGPAADFTAHQAPLSLAGAARALPGAGGEEKFPGRYRYLVLLRPAPPDIRRVFLNSFKAAGLDRTEHDVRWLADSREAGRGWEVLLDGLPAARFAYLPEPGQACVELAFSLERLALASQRKKNISDLSWAGRLTYGDLHRGPGAEGE